jgi:hypothetical protein
MRVRATEHHMSFHPAGHRVEVYRGERHTVHQVGRGVYARAFSRACDAVINGRASMAQLSAGVVTFTMQK